MELLPTYVKRSFRLKSRVDFQAVYARGKSVANRAAVLYVLERRDPSPSRIGFAAGKKLGKAVVRNRVKRRIKEAVRTSWSRVRPGLLLVIIARQGAMDMPFQQLQGRVVELLDRAGVFSRQT